MGEYVLYNGYVLTDDEIEQRAQEWENGTWEGPLITTWVRNVPKDSFLYDIYGDRDDGEPPSIEESLRRAEAIRLEWEAEHAKAADDSEPAANALAS